MEPIDIDDNDPISGLTQADINSFVKTRQDYLDGKTTARPWEHIKKNWN